MIDEKAFIGKRFGAWTVLSRVSDDAKSNHRWYCRCNCGTEKVIAGYNLKNAKSCGCQRWSPLFEDMTGKRVGSWTVISRGENSKKGWAFWNCRCDCGATRIIAGAYLRNGTSKSCGSCGPKRNKIIDLSGNRFCRLVAISRDTTVQDAVSWICKCDCGNLISARTENLRSGNTSSCGCLQKETVIERSTKHGHSKRDARTGTYSSWASMIARCYIPSATHYENYGGRGIRVCDSWLSSFEAFLADMGERPEGKSIDRIDPYGHYCPENCRYATASEQANNKRIHADRRRAKE